MSLMSYLCRDATCFEHVLKGSHNDIMAFLACKAFMERSTANDWEFRLQLISRIGNRQQLNDDQKQFYLTILDKFKKIFSGDLSHRISECLKGLSSSLSCKYYHRFFNFLFVN